MTKQPANTVGELIDLLWKLPRDTPIKGAWEGIETKIEDVLIFNGIVLLDVEGGLREALNKGKLCASQLKNVQHSHASSTLQEMK